MLFQPVLLPAFLQPRLPLHLDAAKPFHSNIHIVNNTFHPFDYPVLYAKSTDGLYFNNNTIIRSVTFQHQIEKFFSLNKKNRFFNLH